MSYDPYRGADYGGEVPKSNSAAIRHRSTYNTNTSQHNLRSAGVPQRSTRTQTRPGQPAAQPARQTRNQTNAYRTRPAEIVDEYANDYDVVEPMRISRGTQARGDGRADMTVLQDELRRRGRRPDTDDDEYIDTTRVTRSPSRLARPQQAQQPERPAILSRRKLLGIGLVAWTTIAACAIGRYEYVAMSDHLKAGDAISATVYRDLGNPQQDMFHCWYDSQNSRIVLEQTPGTKAQTVYRFVSEVTAKPNYLELSFDDLPNGDEQLRISSYTGGSLVTGEDRKDWILIDSGKGHFVGVQPKQPKK